ncbi:vacuolar protein-sorting-associated protein [Striga asiatica]|uniref:Vacuolar protein-sorting-associated protein n=1 Tax=Striga asiatica TaxID=4170 RepID=A0A5A7P3H4_STRAF|nr:vacuolar protein-sorting-associated protein [Striga asiatica]
MSLWHRVQFLYFRHLGEHSVKFTKEVFLYVTNHKVIASIQENHSASSQVSLTSPVHDQRRGTLFNKCRADHPSTRHASPPNHLPFPFTITLSSMANTSMAFSGKEMGTNIPFSPSLFFHGV